MEGALDQYVVQGLGNNITFLRDVYRNPRYTAAILSLLFAYFLTLECMYYYCYCHFAVMLLTYLATTATMH